MNEVTDTESNEKSKLLSGIKIQEVSVGETVTSLYFLPKLSNFRKWGPQFRGSGGIDLYVLSLHIHFQVGQRLSVLQSQKAES